MKGKTTIELLDKNNSLIYKKIEYNKITDGVNNLVNQNFIVNGLKDNGGNVVTTYSPIWKSFAGLLLFTKNLEEDTIIPNKEAFTTFTGNGTDADHYDHSNVYHGYFDASSSKIEAEKLDLNFIFDLNSVAGDIGAISLTSVIGGNNGLANGSQSLFLSYPDQNLQNGNGCGVGVDVPSACFVPYCNREKDGEIIGISEEGLLVCAKVVDANHINIKTYSLSNDVNFTDTFYTIKDVTDFENIYGGTIENLPMLRVEKEETLEFINGVDSLSKITLIGNYLYTTKLNNGTFYLYRYDLKNSSFSYQNINLSIENINDYKNTEEKLYITTNNFMYIVNLSDYKDSPYLHETTYDRIEVLEEGLTPLVFKDTIALMNTKNITAGETRSVYFLTGTNVLLRNNVLFNSGCDELIGFSFNFNEPCFGIINNSGEYSSINVNVFASFLSTINNITIVTKYATVVMKIRYELYTDDYVDE